jgi:hypothetical protein
MAATYLMAHTAEREGFEPSVRFLTLHSLSKRAPSASRSSLLILRGGRLASPHQRLVNRSKATPWGGSAGSLLVRRARRHTAPRAHPHDYSIVNGGGLAEEEGFEPPSPLGDAVFKTAAFNRSATPPCSCQRTGVRDSASFCRCKAESAGGEVPSGVAVVAGGGGVVPGARAAGATRAWALGS